ncbi:MAG: PaaI family thioesterase [Eubacteriales bacterium]|nr:PaaI family thioesterase [Eubacteriales bacterium]
MANNDELRYLENIDKLIEFRNNGGTTSKHMGMKIIEAGPGWAKAEMLCQAFHMNPIGSVHGGMLFILADFVAGMAALTRGKVVTTSSATSYFLNAAYMPKKIFAHATEIKTGQCLSTYDVVVRDDKDKIISKMLIEFYNLRIDFDDYTNNMLKHGTDLYFDKNVFGENKVEAKTFGIMDDETVANMENSFGEKK